MFGFRAYARKAKVKLPSLEGYERRSREAQVIPMPLPNGVPADSVAASTTTTKASWRDGQVVSTSLPKCQGLRLTYMQITNLKLLGRSGQ